MLQGSFPLLIDQMSFRRLLPPSLFTLLIDGSAALVFADGSPDGARAFARSVALHDELVSLGFESCGRGCQASALTVRNASPDEAKHWKRCFDRALSDGEIVADETRFAAFLVAAARTPASQI